MTPFYVAESFDGLKNDSQYTTKKLDRHIPNDYGYLAYSLTDRVFYSVYYSSHGLNGTYEYVARYDFKIINMIYVYSLFRGTTMLKINEITGIG